MKKVLFALAVTALFITFISCKKCVTCSYQYMALSDPTDTVKVVYPDQCGTSTEISDFKDEKGSEAMRYGSELICEDIE